MRGRYETDEWRKTIEMVSRERQRQDDKWGEQEHNWETWCLILGEEFGEVQKAILEARYSGKPWREVLEEMVQVAAVAIASIENELRNAKF